MTLSIQPATLADFSDFFRLVCQLAEYEKLPLPTAEAGHRLQWDGFHPEGPHRFYPLIARQSGEAVGYALYFFTYSSFLAAPTLYLEDIFVAPASRGQGVGYQLLLHLSRVAHQAGCQRMDWTVLDWNTSAIDFYQRLGATPQTQWHLYRFDAEAIQRLALMSN